MTTWQQVYEATARAEDPESCLDVTGRGEDTEKAGWMDGWKRASSSPRNRETELERETDSGLDTQDIFLRRAMACANVIYSPEV